MRNKLSQDLEIYLSATERLCKFFNKKNKEKIDQFEPIIKQTDIKDNLTLDIDGTPYQIDGVHISHRYMPEEYFDVTVNFHNEELKNKFMSQILSISNPNIQSRKQDTIYRNVALDDQEEKHLFNYFNVIVSNIDLGEQDTSALLYMDYWRIHEGSGSKYEKQLFNDLTLNSKELKYVQKAQIKQRGWYAECDD